MDRTRSYPVNLNFPLRIPTLWSLSRGLPKGRNWTSSRFRNNLLVVSSNRLAI